MDIEQLSITLSMDIERLSMDIEKISMDSPHIFRGSGHRAAYSRDLSRPSTFSMDIEQISMDGPHHFGGSDHFAAYSRDSSPVFNQDDEQKGCSACCFDKKTDMKGSEKKILPMLDLETAKEASGDEIYFLVSFSLFFPIIPWLMRVWIDSTA
jgi:hypothetical protein